MTADQGIRIRVNATMAALIVSLLTGAGGVVWAAAKLTVAVESIRTIAISVQDLRERVGVLEDRDNRAYPQSMTPLQQARP